MTNETKIATFKNCRPLKILVIFFTIEMLQLVEHLHKFQTIREHIKPDKFSLMRPPAEDARPTI